MTAWDAWIGREEVRHDSLGAALVQRWCATLDREVPEDGAVPQGLHWCLCVPDSPTARLGDDGHPARDDSPESFLPPLSLPRRMWAAGQVEFLAPLQIGAAIALHRRGRAASMRADGMRHAIWFHPSRCCSAIPR